MHRLDRPPTTHLRHALGALVLFAGFCGALPANAYTWAIIHLEGERPNRTAFFANLDIIASRDDPLERFEVFKRIQAMKVPREQWDERLEAMYKRVEVQVYQVLENPEGPFVRDIKLLFDCPANQVTVRSNLQVYHHNGRNDNGATGGPFTVAAPWVKQARRVGCEEASWRAALNADRATGGNSQAELIKLGMALALDGVVYHEHYDFAFAKLWTDGSQRALSSDKTPEQVEQLRREIIARNELAGKALSTVTGKLEAQIQSEDAERAFVNAVSGNFAKKPEIQRRAMGAQAAWTEAELLGFWGVPQQVSKIAGARVLIYRNQSDERVTQNTVDMRSGQVVNSTTNGQLRQCELSLFLKAGGKVPGPRLVDFQMRGENCNIDTLGKGRPQPDARK